MSERKTIISSGDMGGNRRTILALFIWAMAAVIFMAAIDQMQWLLLHSWVDMIERLESYHAWSILGRAARFAAPVRGWALMVSVGSILSISIYTCIKISSVL